MSLPPTTNTGTWVPQAQRELESQKRKEGPDGSSASKKVKGRSSADPLGEPPPWTTSMPIAVSTPGGEASSSSSTATAAAPAAASPAAAKDEIGAAAPRLAEHIKSVAKFVKVASMATSLLEEGRVTKNNSEAFFEVLEAGMADPKRLREPKFRQAFRRLYGAATSRKELFGLKRQAALRLWQMRVINQIDLHSREAEQVLRICKEVRAGLMLLPCHDPSLEPPPRPGARREMMPEAARPVWAEALFECIEVAMTEVHAHEWAKNDLNTLVKTAQDRRQNFTDAHAEAILGWNRKRKDGAGELKALFGVK